jgi:hypothetical protein
MNLEERMDQLEARLIAHSIAIPLMLDGASPEVKAAIRRAAASAQERGLATELTDLQLEQIQQVLLSLSQ